MANDPVDQDAIAAQWEASLDSEDPAQAAEAAAANELSGTMALQWAAMVEDGSRDLGGKNSGERVLSQEETPLPCSTNMIDVNASWLCPVSAGSISTKMARSCTRRIWSRT